MVVLVRLLLAMVVFGALASVAGASGRLVGQLVLGTLIVVLFGVALWAHRHE